jgi:hypothetical protein
MSEDDTSVQAQPLRSRQRFRLIALATVAMLVVVLAGGYLFLANAYMPIAEGGGSGPDSGVPGSLFARSVADPFSAGTQFVYCSEPSSRIDWFMTLMNNGPLPVTILGGDPGPGRVTTDTNVNGFSLVDLARYRQALPADTPAYSHDRTDPRTAPAMPPTTLASEDQLEVWARFQTGTLQLQSDSTMSVRSVWVRYSVLGVVRTAEVPLRDGVAVAGGCTPAG